MPEKWDADRELDRALVEKTIRGQFPDLEVESIDYLGSGWDFDAFVLNDEMVLRYPRRAAVAELLEREENILTTLDSFIGGKLNIPRICLKGNPDTNFPYSFVGHELIAGVAADDARVPVTSELANDIGSALNALHGVTPTPELEALFGFEPEGIRPRFEETRSEVEQYDSVRSLVPTACEWLEHEVMLPVEFKGTPRLVHNDLCPEHVIVDPNSGRLAGIIDWSDIAIGDPALDFIMLVLWRGNEFLPLVMEAYGLPVDDGFRDRLQFLSRTLSIKWLVDALRRDGDINKNLGWVQNAF